MITLNIDHGFRQVTGWEDIEAMPGFQRNLDPSQHKLESIVGRYAFPAYVQCGLSNCHTPHGKGYIAKTVDGALTNIGKDCGKKYFGVDFETLSATFERNLKETEQRERLNSFSLQIEGILARVTELREGDNGARWIHKMIEHLKSPRDVPEPIVRQVEVMVKGRTNQLIERRLATKAEREAMAATGQREAYIIDEIIAEVAGVEALYPENDLRMLLVFTIEEPLRQLDKLDIGSLTPAELRKWVKIVDGIEPALERAGQAIVEGRKLLTAENLEPLLRIEGIWREGMPNFNDYLRHFK